MPSIIESLVLEHQSFCALFNCMQGAFPRLGLSELKTVTRHMEQLLLGHAAAEDDLVLLALNEVPENKRRYERFHKEHQEIDGQLIQLYSVDDFAQAEHLLNALIAHSRRHFLHEERVVFPLLEQVMGIETLSRLGNVWGLRRQATKEVMAQLMKRLQGPTPNHLLGAERRVVQAFGAK